MSPHRAASSIGLICAVLVVTGLTGCTASDDRSDPPDTTLPAASVVDDGGDALPGVKLPAAGSTGVVIQVPGELDALIAAHASARDDLRSCIDDHDVSSSGVDAQRFPC